MTSDIARALEEAKRNCGCLLPDTHPGECTVCRLAAIVREQQERIAELTQWRPIETAPRDGTPVLIAHENGDVFRATCVGKHWRFGECWAPDDAVRGWLPLPAVEVGK